MPVAHIDKRWLMTQPTEVLEKLATSLTDDLLHQIQEELKNRNKNRNKNEN